MYQPLIDKAIAILKKGGTILYPTDTVWGIGCDATNAEAVKRVYAIKKRAESKALITLLPNLSDLQKYVVFIPDAIAPLLAKAQRPTTIIYPKAQRLAPNVIAENGSIAIRIPKHDFCQALLTQWGKPLVSTSANISGEPTPRSYHEIKPIVKQQVDYALPFSPFAEQPIHPPSRILLINEMGELVVIRD